MSLFGVTKERIELFSIIDKLDGELDENTELGLKITEENYKDEVEKYRNWTVYLKADIQTINDEIQRLRKLKEVKSNLIDRLKNSIKDSLPFFGTAKEKGNFFLQYDTWKVQTQNLPILKIDEGIIFTKNTNEVLNVFRFNALSIKDYDGKVIDLLNKNNVAVSITPKTTIDKTKLKDYLKDGGEVKGAYIDTENKIIKFY